MNPLHYFNDNITQSALKRFAARTPLLLPTVAFVIGVLVASECAASLTLVMAGMLAGCMAAVFVLIPPTYRHSTAISIVACLLAMLLTGGHMTTLNGDATIDLATARYTALVTQQSENNYFQKLRVRLLSVNGNDTSPVDVQLSVGDFTTIYDEGMTIRFKAALRPLDINRDVDDEIIPEQWLWRNGCRYRGIITNHTDITIINQGRGRNLFRRIGLECKHLIADSELSALAKSYLQAFLTGDRTLLDPGERNLFSAAGVAHMLALSGTHTGVIAMLAGMILLPLNLFGWSRWRPLGVCGLVWMFALSTGAQPSVVRASTMLTVFMIGRVLMRSHSSANSLCLSALILLVINPLNLYDLGFQLSFGSVASILAFGNSFNPVNPRHHRLHMLFAIWSVSVAATLGTALISTLHFHFFPVYFLLGNTIVGFLVPVIIGAGVIFLAMSAIGLKAGLLAKAISGICALANISVTVIGKLPGSTIDDIYFPAATIVPYVLALIALRLWLVNRRRIYAMLTLSLTLVVALVMAAELIVAPHSPTWFINTHSTAPLVMVEANGRLTVHTPGNRPLSAAQLDALAKRYARHMKRRGLCGPLMATSDEWGKLPDGQSFFIVGPHTRFNDLPYHCNYLIIGKNSRFDRLDLLNYVAADSVIEFTH